jgi:hypothetical protein
MPLSLAETQAVNEMAGFMYDFLPGKPYPYADPEISFAGVAHRAGLSDFWTGGSKLPAITTLLEKTLETQRGRFCELVLAIVRQGIKYRSNKGKPITREEIQQLNEIIKRVQFKIPQLWDPSFLDSLPSARAKPPDQQPLDVAGLKSLKEKLIGLNDLDGQARGYAFERFLQELFEFFGLKPRSPFRLVGEQIDGSFQLGGATYLVEAKWHREQTDQNALLVFRGKVESKAVWSRGMFISYSGFTDDGLEAFSKGRATNIIGTNGEDLFFILDGKMSLTDAIGRKTRRAAETGEFFVSVYELLSEE